MRKKVSRRRKQEIATTQPEPRTPTRRPFPLPSDMPQDVSVVHGAASIDATIAVLQALTDLPSDRAKTRVLRFVQDYFDERHGH